METIYHIAQRDEWAEAKRQGKYWPSVPAHCPFIHFSFRSQVLDVANFLFAGREDLLLLEVDRARVEKDLKVETPNDKEDEKYPHLYRALYPKEVLREAEFIPSPDGSFEKLPYE